MEDPTISSHSCAECAKGTLTLKRSGLSVTGECDICGHKVEFQLPAKALQELTDQLIAARVAQTRAEHEFEVRKTFAEAEDEAQAPR